MRVRRGLLAAALTQRRPEVLDIHKVDCCLGYGGGQKKIKHFFAWRIVVQVNRIANGAARGFRSAAR
jgi:hypothetical protein